MADTMGQPKSSTARRFPSRIRLIQLIIVIAASMVYILAFLEFRHTLGDGMSSLSVLPVALAGWFFGLRGGLIASLVAFAAHMCLMTTFGIGDREFMDVLRGGSGAGSVALLLTGVVVGRLRDLSERVKLELAERMKAEEPLRESEERFHAVAQSANEAIVISDGEGKIVWWNKSAERIFQYTENEVVGQHVTILMPEPYLSRHRQAVQRLHATGEFKTAGRSYEAEALKKDGSQFPVEISLTTWNTAKGKFHSAIVRDITNRKRVEDELRYMSTHDGLTGLYNRAYFEAELARHQQGRHYPVSVMMADVDGLKGINDKFGHAVGDDILRQAASVLRASFRAEDVIARIGGDEFAVLLPSTGTAVAAEAMARIRRNLAAHNASHTELTLSLSLGAATAWTNEELTEALKQADEHMYLEKAPIVNEQGQR